MAEATAAQTEKNLLELIWWFHLFISSLLLSASSFLHARVSWGLTAGCVVGV